MRTMDDIILFNNELRMLKYKKDYLRKFFLQRVL